MYVGFTVFSLDWSVLFGFGFGWVSTVSAVFVTLQFGVLVYVVLVVWCCLVYVFVMLGCWLTLAVGWWFCGFDECCAWFWFGLLICGACEAGCVGCFEVLFRCWRARVV